MRTFAKLSLIFLFGGFMNTINIRIFIALQISVILFLSSAAFAQETGSWAAKSSNGFTARSDFASSAVGNKIYAIGGDDNSSYPTNILEVYDATTGTWSTPSTTGAFTVRDGLTTAVINGKIYVMGGYDGGAYAVNKLDVFDPSTNAWSAPQTTGTFTGRGGLTSAVVGGKIYVIGGTNAGPATIVNAVEVFDPVTNKWSTATTTGTFTGRAYLTSAVVNGKIYVIGGINGSGSAVTTLDVFDPATNTWSTPATTGTFSPRIDLASSVLNGKIYVFGGQKGNSYLNTLEVFDPSTNAWSTPSTTGTFTARNGLTASVVNGVIYVMGGYNGITELNANEAYTPDAAPPAPGTLSLAASQLNFGVHDYTKDSLLTATVHNPSTTAVSIDQATIAGTNSADFKVLSNSKQANLPYLLQPGDDIGFVIQYTAPSVTESDNATLRILFDQSTDSIRTVTLSGSSQKPAAPKPGTLTLAVSQLNFGAHNYTKDSMLTAMVRNLSASAVSIDQVTLTGTNPTDFKIPGNTKQASIPFLLQAGDSIGFIVQYIAPSATESDNALLRILFDGSADSIRTIALSGSAQKPSGNGVSAADKTELTVSIYPNPATSEMHISYSIPKSGDVSLSIFDITGKEIARIASEAHDGGSYETLWDARAVPTGSYILKLSACGESMTKVVEIMK